MASKREVLKKLETSVDRRKAKKKTVNFYCTQEEFEIIVQNAKEFNGGNMGGWVRHCALKHRPRKGDLKYY